jgi:TRAP-type C4-dicarboxylate transport system permease small subunit
MEDKIQKVLQASFACIDKSTIVFAYISACLAITFTLLVVVSVLARYVFNQPQPWSDEIVGYLFLSHCLLALAYATYKKAHVAAEMLFVHFPPRVQFIVTLTGYLLALWCISFIVYYGSILTYQYLIRDWRSDTAYAVILWPFVMMIPLGFLLFGLQCLSRIRVLLEDKKD